jgi:putative transposase
MAHPTVSVRRQCALLQLTRSTLYYRKQPENQENLALMRLMDEQYTKMPYYGVRRMTAWVNTQGYRVNKKRVRRLMRVMGLEAQYPKPKLSKPNPNHTVYPYLLKHLSIENANQVWGADITYIPLKQGFVYLFALMDWHSRYVVSWQVSTSLDSGFCVEALNRALQQNGCPQIVNTDQGCQFTSLCWTDTLKDAGVQISMDGRGRYLDNIFVERLWRTVKYEEVYLKQYDSVKEAKQSLDAYFRLYNTERLHQSLDYQPPQVVYLAGCGKNGQKPPSSAFTQFFHTTDDDDTIDRLRA